MQRVLLLILAAAACNGGTGDAGLTAADVTGTWNGESMMVGSDSVVATFTATSTSDSTGTLTASTFPGPVAYTVTFDGDSMVTISEPYAAVLPPGDTAMVTFRSVGRMEGEALVGQTTLRPAMMPDSTVGTRHWRATRQP